MASKIAIALLALAAVGINARPTTEEEEQVFRCLGKSDGYYSDPADPMAYYSCYQGDLVARVICETGYIFDGSESCIPFYRDNEDASTDVEGGEKFQIPQNLPQVPKYPDDDDDDEEVDNYLRNSKKKIYNIEITYNNFPASIIMIGKMNREQKNK